MPKSIWPAGANEKACEFFDLDPTEYEIFMMATDGDYIDDDAFVDKFEDEDGTRLDIFDSCYELREDPAASCSSLLRR